MQLFHRTDSGSKGMDDSERTHPTKQGTVTPTFESASLAGWKTGVTKPTRSPSQRIRKCKRTLSTATLRTVVEFVPADIAPSGKGDVHFAFLSCNAADMLRPCRSTRSGSRRSRCF